jgi:hypothetical protein
MSMHNDRGQATTYPKASDMVLSGPMECKLCEMGCGRSFMRPVPLTAPRGLKYCAGCLGLKEASRIRQAEEYARCEVKARRGVM